MDMRVLKWTSSRLILGDCMALSLIIEKEKGVTFGGAEVSDFGSDWVWNMKVCVGG